MEQAIIQYNIDKLQGGITEQLHPSFQVRFLEYHKLRQEKPDREADTKRDNIGSYIGRKAKMTQLHHFLFLTVNHFDIGIRRQQEIIAYKKNEQAQHGYTTPTGNVPEGLYRYPFPERRMKKIDHRQQDIPDKINGSAISVMFHKSAKVRKMKYF